MKRRDFVHRSLSATALLALQAHTSFAFQNDHDRKTTDGKPLIKSLTLLTTTPIDEMRKFYQEVIGLPVISQSRSHLSVRGGETPIIFIRTNETGDRPFYHFAFNIPENKIQSAFQWQRAKTPLVKPGVDSVVNFAHWNAHSIFFLDPAGNLLEYIARHDLKNSAPGDFSSKDILYVSEIGLIVEDVNTSGTALQEALKLTEYRPATPGFWPIGDEYGLLLMIQLGREWASHPGQTNTTKVFKTMVSINTILDGWKFPDYPYEILKSR